MDMLEEIKDFLERGKPELRSLSDDIWNHPETAYTEKYAVARVGELLKSRGFEVISPYCGLETAFRCEYGSDGGPVFAFASEYDALPEIGHGCGHNLICMVGVAGFLATADFLKRTGLPGKTVLFGTPAEEGGGGKVKLEAAGCLKGIDAVVMAHPSGTNLPDPGSSANCGLEVIFHGRSAHAASAHEAVNALDAMHLLYSGISAFRQQLPEHARIHGVILEGGTVPNVIPDRTRCRFYLRSGVENWLAELEKRFRNMVKGAELMTGTTAEVFPFRPPYRCCKPNAAMNLDYAECMKRQGMEVIFAKHPGRGSSDFGNFSQVIPGVQPYFAVSNTSRPPGHSTEFRDCAGADAGFENGLNAAASLAHIGCRFLSDPDFRQRVRRDFEES